MSDSPQPPQPTPDAEPPQRVDPVSADKLIEQLGQDPDPAPAALPTPEELQPSLPQYEILSLLGRGGMGAVYKARQKALDRVVALKLLPPALSGDSDFVARFAREARAMARLNHPSVITVHDSGQTTEGRLYFVMEFVDGTTLAELIRSGSLDPAQVLAITAQICDALGYAHGEGVVHRDVKPANVMVDWHGRVKVADFGLARLIGPEVEPGFTSTGTVMGTLDYMAPEQRRGMHVDHRADIFSLGVMLYEMFCRELPHGVFAPPSQRCGCDVRIDEIVNYAMQQEPNLRYQSTQDFKAAVEVVRTTAARLPKPRTKRSRARTFAMVAAALAVGALGFFALDLPGKWRTSGAKSTAVVGKDGKAVDPAEQARRVIAKLKELNPGFDPGTASWRVEGDHVFELTFNITAITDLTPVRELASLTRLRLGQTGQTSRLESLEALRGLKLEVFECFNTEVSDLSPLRGMPLKRLVCSGSKVSDLEPVVGCPLQVLAINQSLVTNLDGLRGMQLTTLNCGASEITDLEPLKGMPLTDLRCSRTRVRDLSPLAGIALTKLDCSKAFIEDLSPLRGMPLKELDCDFDARRDSEVLRSISTLERINGLLAAEFWRTR